jgi:hypothetical protein
MPEDAEAQTEKLRSQVERRRRQVRSVMNEMADLPPSKGKRLFEAGNRYGSLKGKKRLNSVEEMDAVARETITRLRRREFIEVPDGAGGTKRAEKKLEASTANAITLALRLRLELYGQFEVAAEVARLQGDLRLLQEGLGEVMTSRSG